jgi:hypothetical protein
MLDESRVPLVGRDVEPAEKRFEGSVEPMRIQIQWMIWDVRICLEWQVELSDL